MESLGIEDAQVFVRGVDRPNISLLRWRALRDYRAEYHHGAMWHPSAGAQGKLMIFVPTRKIGEALQRYFDQQGLKKTPFYHSNFERRGTVSSS